MILNDIIMYILSFFVSTIKKDLQIQQKLEEQFLYDTEDIFLFQRQGMKEKKDKDNERNN